MLTLISVWLTERIVTVFTVVLVAIATVPTTLLIVSENGTITVQRQQEEQQKVLLIQSIKHEGEFVIAKLKAAEASCNTQVTQIATAPGVSAVKTQQALALASGKLKTVVTPLVVSVAQVEDEFAHLTLVTPEDRDEYITKINLILIKGVGDGQTAGVIVTTCETILIEVKLIIVVFERDNHHHYEGEE